MTTTAAANSASTSASNDSSSEQGINDAPEPASNQQPRLEEQSRSPTRSPPNDCLQHPSPANGTTDKINKTSPESSNITVKPNTSSSSTSSSCSSSSPSSTLTLAQVTTGQVAPNEESSPQAPTLKAQATKDEPLPLPQQPTTNGSSNGEQKRPMNAFLLFCQKQRSLVREKYPNLENRGITRILGDWWTKLDKEQKSKYTDLARQQKEEFLKANPDFKWCKTPNVSNMNNNNNSSNSNASNNCTNNSNSQNQPRQHYQNSSRHQQNSYPPGMTPTTKELLSLQSIHHHPMDVVHQSSNSIDIATNKHQHPGAPKPPKKRFLERNDPVYTTRKPYAPSHLDTMIPHGTDVVPYISLDQDTLDRVIDKAFSEDSGSSPSGKKSCKIPITASSASTLSMNQNLSFTQPYTSTPASTSTPSCSINPDEPVDFSMNRTINTTRQQMINNVVEKML